jgi:anaerobic magnesium-protoporphyrin IX monomethyl ester cyclase
MKVALCYVGGEMMENKFMSLAPYHLAGCLRASGYEATVAEITPANYEDEALFDSLADFDLVGFSCNTFTYAFHLPVIRKLKSRVPGIKTVMGGIHALHSAEEMFRESPVDYVCIGEGDVAIVELVQALDGGRPATGIRGLSYRAADGEIVSNGTGSAPRGSDELPLAAYDLLPRTPPVLVFETSRGCPYRCTFCSIDMTSKWSGWSPDDVVRRFDAAVGMLREKTMAHVTFADDNFATDQRRAADILRKLHEAYPALLFSFETRAREILRNPIVLNTCLEIGLRSQFLFGIECGYDEGLKHINKALTVDDIHKASQLCKSLGMATLACFSFIIGFPWEGEAERLKTLNLARELGQKYGIRCRAYYWLPTPSPLASEYGIRYDYTVPFWWREVQVELARQASDEEARLMADINGFDGYSESRNVGAPRPEVNARAGRSPRELPTREQAIEEYLAAQKQPAPAQ